MTTFLAIAENSKLEFLSFRCGSKGKLEEVDGKLIMSEVLLEPIVTVGDDHSADRALKVLQKAEMNCLISNSVKTKVVMKPTVQIEKQKV
jgi:organic hydroperoxide reductase OsmC/OhrA